jgi:hypothetical protein
MAVNAQDYALPEVIGRIHNGGVYRYDFCKIGDHNGDGCDEIMMRSQENIIDVYFGSENMGAEIGYQFDVAALFEGEYEVIARPELMNIGYLIPNRQPFLGLMAVVLTEPLGIYTILYEGGESLDQTPEFIHRDNFSWSVARSSKPFDFNGDGYGDILTSIMVDDYHRKLRVYFGGADFDTTLDWEISNFGTGVSWVSGYDLNNDGCDDVIIRTDNYTLYLGGDPPDTNFAFQFGLDHFEGRVSTRNIRYGYSMLQDINDDGYDDWGLYFTESEGMSSDDGYMIFFGSEEPDMIPDLELEGHRRLWQGEGELCGGDFNGDGIGDIAAGMSAVIAADMGEVHIHFGSRWIDGEADIYINSSHEYDGEFFPLGRAIGGVGDYNGDGIDDFVVRARREDPELVVFAGNRDWQVDAPDELLPQEYKLSVNANPNPFNNSININFEIPIDGIVELIVYDIRGREVETIIEKHLVRGSHKFIWKSESAGVYFLALSYNQYREIRKIVCVR